MRKNLGHEQIVNSVMDVMFVEDLADHRNEDDVRGAQLIHNHTEASEDVVARVDWRSRDLRVRCSSRRWPKTFTGWNVLRVEDSRDRVYDTTSEIADIHRASERAQRSQRVDARVE